MAPSPAEVELKLRLPEAEVQRLLRHPAVAPLRRARPQRARLIAVYYDTPGKRLARAGVGLRVRRSGRHWIQTLKGPQRAGSPAGLASRDEFEWPLPGGVHPPEPDLAKVGETPYRTLAAKALKKGPLRAQFTTDFSRTTIPLAFPDSTMALLCIDRGTIRANLGSEGTPVESALCEIELEIEAGSVERLFELALALMDDLPLSIELRSKAQRGYALLEPVPPTPVRAEDAPLAENATAAQAFAAILGSCLGQMVGNADGVAADEDPEWIHQMRIGVRRLRSALSLLRTHLPPAALGHLQDDLRWIASALGPARDLDVFLTETLPTLREAARHAPAHAGMLDTLEQLDARARTRVLDARRDARSAVASRRFTRLALSLGALVAGDGLVTPAAAYPAASLSLPARVFAAGVLKRRHRNLLRRGENLAALAPGERHAVRIAAKKLRYATEFFAPLFPDKRTRGYRKALAALQAILGILNDAAVAASLASELSKPGAPAAALFAGWAAAQGEAHEVELLRAWRRFAGHKPFWEVG